MNQMDDETANQGSNNWHNILKMPSFGGAF